MTYRFFDLKTQKIVGPDGYFIDDQMRVYEENYMYTGGMFEFLPQLKLRESIIAEPSTGIKDNTGTTIYFGDVIKFLLGSDEHSGLVTYRDATFGVFIADGFVPLNMIVMETIEITGRILIDVEEMKQSQKEFEQSLQEDLLNFSGDDLVDQIVNDFLKVEQDYDYDIVDDLPEDSILKQGAAKNDMTDLDDEQDEPVYIEFDLVIHDIECEPKDSHKEDTLFSIENAMTIGIAPENSAPTNETDETESQSEPTDFVQDQEPETTPERTKLQRRPLAAKTLEEIKQPEPHKPSIERKPMPALKLKGPEEGFEVQGNLSINEFELEGGIFRVISITDTEIELRPKASTSNLFKSLIQKVNGNVRLQNFYKKNAIRQMTIQEANELLKRMKEARIQWPK